MAGAMEYSTAITGTGRNRAPSPMLFQKREIAPPMKSMSSSEGTRTTQERDGTRSEWA